MAGKRIDDLCRFYAALCLLEERLGGMRTLSTSSGKTGWPRRGVYFFTEPDERRRDSGHGYRIVRVGTHALKEGGSTTLWNRLSQHRGQLKTGGGNHRGSIFRLIVGTALIAQHGYHYSTWGVGGSAASEIRAGEILLEREVSRVIRAMPFLWLGIDDDPGPRSLRGYIERNAIALLSNYGRERLDPPSDGWLGRHCDRERVRNSGIWNSNHVDEQYDPGFLEVLEQMITRRES